VEVTARPTSHLLTKPTGSLAGVDFSLNPYIGCGFDCSYCYAANFVPDDDRKANWGRWIEVKTSAIEEMEWSDRWQGKRLFMSSATDPYQPIEAKVGLSRGILEVLSRADIQPSLLIQTRGPLVTRDIDILRKLTRLRVNMSITTDSDEVRKVFEPSCASIERRLAAVQELKSAGIAVGVCISPMLPLNDPIAFAERIAEINPDVVVSGSFHYSDRRYAASTRDRAIPLLKAFNWTYDDYTKAKEVIRGKLPGCFNERGFMPAQASKENRLR
jgi:DNA repair photolyase